MKDVHSGVQPLRISALRLIELLYLFLEHGEHATSGIAGLETVGEWVLKEIALCTLVVGFQGIVEN